MRKFLMTAVAAIALAATSPAATGNAQTVTANGLPSFLEAATFFLDGVDGEGDELQVNEVQGGRVALKTIGGMRHIYLIMDDDPCTVIQMDVSIGVRGVMKAYHINFSKLPGPRDIIWNGAGYLMPNVVEGAICVSTVKKDDSALAGLSFPNKDCRKGSYNSSAIGSGYRQMSALQYIRSNFCMGLPESPTPPPRPY